MKPSVLEKPLTIHTLLHKGLHALVFKKSEFEGHWYYDACPHVGNSIANGRKHESVAHAPVQYEFGLLLVLRNVARHRGAGCPERLISCCEGFDGLCEHESVCESRAIECVKCKANVRLRDVEVHAEKIFHGVRKQNQRPCSNRQCTNAPNAHTQTRLVFVSPVLARNWFPTDPINQKLAIKILLSISRAADNGLRP
ncbi:hypothetical protein BC830DRAFT_1184888 [Chytriomyces sp. MP71]|nr:hypothetical protein BC830DRAFT_1184888 [Chytriomyces sp. MP71]